MKISIKLKPDELHALVHEFEQRISTDVPTRRDAIVVVLMVRFYKKLKEKSIFIEKPLRMSVGPETAMAFCDFFFDVPLDRSTFSGNLISKTMAHFDQQTAGLFNHY